MRHVFSRRQSGNVMLALFAAIGAVGVVGATSMTVMKGPVRGMHNVTQKTIAENNMIASSKLAVMAAANQPNGGDCDGDNTVEPVAWSITGTGPKPAGGGYLPANIGASLQDPWGNTYGYCVWDHGSAIQTTCPTPTQRLRGAGVGGSGPVITIISSGPDRVFQTSCANAPTYVTKVSGSDDIVLSYTYAEAQSASGGLWNLQASDLNTAEISKNLEVKNASGTTTFELDRTTGIGDFIGIRTGSIAAKGVEPVSMAGGLKIDSDTNVTQCNLPQHKGIIRYHATEGLEVCDGTQWMAAGGGAVPGGTIAAFASNTCPSGWSEYSPARGRFLRGRDPSGTNDAVRSAGNVQADSNRSHTHTGTAASAGAHTHTGTAAGAGSHTHSGSTSPGGAHNHSYRFNNGQGGSNETFSTAGGRSGGTIGASGTSGIFGVGDHTHGMSLDYAGDHTHSLSISAAAAHTHTVTVDADGGTESRPKNVAVTYCMYNGGVPVKEIAGLGNLHDVILSAPQVGQVLTYDGSKWVNDSILQSQWINSGANIYFNTGNVGVGTASPAQKIHTTGNVRADGRIYYFGAGQTLTGDNSSAVTWSSNHSTITQMIFSDLENTIYGRVYGSGDGVNFGLMDGDGNWSYLAVKDSDTRFYIDNVIVMRLYPTYLDMYNSKISRVLDPTAAQDAATKAYVDARVAATSGANETDPSIGAITNGRWCRGVSGKVVCDQVAPTGGGAVRQVVTATKTVSGDGNVDYATATCPAGYLVVSCQGSSAGGGGGFAGGAGPGECVMNFSSNNGRTYCISTNSSSCTAKTEIVCLQQ